MCHHVSMYLDSSTICVTCYLDSKSMDSNQKSQNPLCNGLGTIPTPFRTVQAARTMLGQMPWRPCSNASGRVLRVIQRSWRLSGCCQRTQFFQTFHIGGGLLSKTPFVWEDPGDPQNLGHWDSCTQRYVQVANSFVRFERY